MLKYLWLQNQKLSKERNVSGVWGVVYVCVCGVRHFHYIYMLIFSIFIRYTNCIIYDGTHLPYTFLDKHKKSGEKCL